MSQTNQTNNYDTRFTKIFVRNLTWRTTSDDLRNYFEQFGEVIDANVVCETYPGRSKGYGFVTGRITNCNLASLGAKNNINQPNKTGSFNHVRPPHQYQLSPQHIIPYCPPITWDPLSGQYWYMYNNPCYHNSTQMNYHRYDLMTQHYLHQTNRQRIVISTPQRSSVRTESIIGTDQELIADVAHHDNKEVVTKPDSDVANNGE